METDKTTTASRYFMRHIIQNLPHHTQQCLDRKLEFRPLPFRDADEIRVNAADKNSAAFGELEPGIGR
jgi:hypothetical protein